MAKTKKSDLVMDIPVTIEWDERYLRFRIRDANTGELIPVADITYYGNDFGARSFEFEVLELDERRNEFVKEWTVYTASDGEARARLTHYTINAHGFY